VLPATRQRRIPALNPAEAGIRFSDPIHLGTAVSVQRVPKAAYHKGHHNKHNRLQ